MSVQVNQYIGYGFFLPFKEARQALVEKFGEEKYEELTDNYYDSAFDSEVKSINDCSMIEDGMNGKYTFFGKVFKKSENYEHLQTCEIPKIGNKIKENVKKEFEAIFGTNFNEYHAKIMLITHYR